MARMMDLLRASALPSHRMQAASRGALTVEPAEMIEIMVYLANNNKIYGQQAKMTLAGYDEASSLQVAGNPASPKEVLKYMIAPENLRPVLLPVLVENPGVLVDWIVELAATGSREVAEAIQKSKRAAQSSAIQSALAANPHLAVVKAESATKESAPSGGGPNGDRAGAASQINENASGEQSPPSSQSARSRVGHPADLVAAEAPAAVSGLEADLAEESTSDADPAVNEGLTAYLAENAGEIAAETGKAFQPIGGVLALEMESEDGEEAVAESAPVTPSNSPAEGSSSAAATAAKRAVAVRRPKPQDGKRDNTLQKINKLDVKGRIQLAMKGSKEERSILIRDGTKVVALAVLESPKLTDGEVEKFAGQKNVLEAVLRAIPMKRRFMKIYGVLRNLAFNPRSPIDVSLGLMKHLLVQDLKNLSGNKEVSDTIRKLAIKMFKQKMELGAKKQ